MSCPGEENTYISHLIECAISENTDQDTIKIPGTILTGPNSIEENQIFLINNGPSPILIQRHFDANDPFCLGSESGTLPLATFESTDVSQDYSQFVVQKPVAPITVNAFSENPLRWQLVEISDEKESLINERRKAENNYFQQFMSNESGRSLSDQSNVISDTNVSFGRRIISQVTSGENVIPNSNQLGSNRTKTHSKTFLKPNEKLVPRVKLSDLVDKAKGNRQSKVKLVSESKTSFRGQSNDGSTDKEVAAHIELREIQENTYLKYFLDLCHKKETEADSNKEDERKSKKRACQSNGKTSDDSIEIIKDNTIFNIEDDLEPFQNSTEECLSSDDGNDNTPLICGLCGLVQTKSTELDQHLETEHSKSETNEASHESENEYWRLTKELVKEQRKRILERRKEEKRAEENLTREIDKGTKLLHESLDKPKSRKCQQGIDKRYTKPRQARGRFKMGNKENENSCVDPKDKSGSPNINKTEDSKPDENDSDDDIEIIEPTIELVVIDSSDDEDNVAENKGSNNTLSHSTTGTPSKTATMLNEKISTSNTPFKGCSVNLSRMKINEFDKTIENRNNFTKLKKSNVPKVNLGNIASKDCKVILDRVKLTDEQLSHSRVTQKDINIRSKKQLKPINSESKIRTPQCSVSLEKLSPQNFGQTDMNNIIKYLINCEAQNKDKLLMQKYGIKDVSVSVSKTPTISEEVSRFFSREHNFTKLGDSFSEFSSIDAPSFKSDDQISLVSNRSVSPQPSTSSGHSYIPRKRTARKSAKDNTMKRGHTRREPKVILQNLSSIDIALLKNPNSSYRKSNWLNMFSEESSDSDDNVNNKIPIKSLLDNLDEGVNEPNTDSPIQKKGKGKAICRNNQRSYTKNSKSCSSPLSGTIKQETADIDLLKKFGITRSIVLLQDEKSNGIDKHRDNVTKSKIEVDSCKVNKDSTSQDNACEKGNGTKKIVKSKRFVRKDPVSSQKGKKSFVESKKFVRKVPIYSPTALSLIKSARLKKSLKSSINLRGNQSEDLRRHSLESRVKQKRPKKEMLSKVDKAKNLKKSIKFDPDIRKKNKGKQTLHTKKEIQQFSARSQKSYEGISNLDLCKPFSINLTSIDRKNVMNANIVNVKLANTFPVEEEICKSELIDSEIEFSDCACEKMSVKVDSEQKPDSLNWCIEKESNYNSQDEMGDHESESIDYAPVLEKCMEKETDSTTNAEVVCDTRQKEEVTIVEDMKMEIGNENSGNNTESPDVKSSTKENDNNGKVSKRKFEENLIRSPSKLRKLSAGKKDEDSNVASIENSNTQVKGDCYSSPETEYPDKIPDRLQKVKKNIVEKQVGEEVKYINCKTECLTKSNIHESMPVDKKSVAESKGKECIDVEKSRNKIENDLATVRENSESLLKNISEFIEGRHCEEIANEAINGSKSNSPKTVNEGTVKDKSDPIYESESNESKKDDFVATNETVADNSSFLDQVGKNENTIKSIDDSIEHGRNELVAPAIMLDHNLKNNQYKNDKVKDIVEVEISKSHEHENKKDECKHIKETSEIHLNSRDKQSKHIVSENKRKLVIIEAITTLNEQDYVVQSKDNEKQDSKETICSERTEKCAEDSVGIELSSEQEIGFSSSQREGPFNSIDVMDNQTKDVVGTCYIHQEKSDSPVRVLDR